MPDKLTRRSVLKGSATAGASMVGLSAAGTAVASDGSWNAHAAKKRYVSTRYYRDEIGVGLRHLASDDVGEKTFHTFEFGTEGVVVVDDTDEFPTDSEEYKEINDDCIPPQAGWNADNQGFLLETGSDLYAYIEGDGDELWVHPPECDSYDDYVEISTAVLESAISGYSAAAGALIDAVELYNSLKGVDGTRQEMTFDYLYGLGRGGLGGHLVIEVDSGEFGNVSLTAHFGDASTGFDIYADGDGYSVIPKDSEYD